MLSILSVNCILTKLLYVRKPPKFTSIWGNSKKGIHQSARKQISYHKHDRQQPSNSCTHTKMHSESHHENITRIDGVQQKHDGKRPVHFQSNSDLRTETTTRGQELVKNKCKTD